MILEGKILGNRYEMLEKIGNGGMAIVYKARDIVLNRNVAVKVLRDEFTTDDEFIRRFETEAQSAARLTHSNIVSIFDVGVDNGIYYIVMELIQGKTLKEIIVEEQGPLPWKWSVNVAIQIASALEMAHRNNIVHRDIKPHNIIITEDGVAKVTDFGIAKAVSNSTITAFGTTIGSVHYFSPEHARGGFTDAKSDIYSLGVVMYEMITGKVPFDADTPVSVALKHMQEQPVPPIKINSNVPVAVNKIIMKALQKDPTLRYQTATEIVRDLKIALKNPTGDFVEQKEYDPTAVTQKIATDAYGNVIDEAENRSKNKKEPGFIQRHKKLSTFLGLILLFFLAFGGTMLFLNLTNPPEVELPKLVGLSKDEAQRAAQQAKLVFEIEREEYNKDVGEGLIISQDPAYSEKYNKVKQGSTVKVVVSKGTEKTTVPKVVGKKEDEATQTLEEAKLKAEVIEETSKKVEEGYVISQEIEADTEVSAGDTIKIHVSTGTGIKQVTMISVVGKTEADAKKEIEELGLKANIGYEEDSSKENGKVTKQSIEVGKVIDEGTTVTITVNKLAEMKSVAVKVNVKSLLNGDIYEKIQEISTNTATENKTQTDNKKVKKVKVKVTVGGDTIYSQTVDASETNLSAGTTKGTGTKEIKVYIDDILKNQGQINYSDITTYTAE